MARIPKYDNSAHAVADPVLHDRAEIQRGEAHQDVREDQYYPNCLICLNTAFSFRTPCRQGF
jgi:hypothetical protein